MHLKVYEDIDANQAYSLLQDTPHFFGLATWLLKEGWCPMNGAGTRERFTSACAGFLPRACDRVKHFSRVLLNVATLLSRSFDRDSVYLIGRIDGLIATMLEKGRLDDCVELAAVRPGPA